LGVIKKVADNGKSFSQLVITTSFAENPNWYKKCYQNSYQGVGQKRRMNHQIRLAIERREAYDAGQSKVADVSAGEVDKRARP
jgi:hypothetical protein